MPVWLIASLAGIALPMLFKGKEGQQQATQAAASGHFFPGGMQPAQALPPPSSYPIPLDGTIDPQSAYAVYQAWKTAPAPHLLQLAREIWGQFPIASAVLYARGLTFQELQAAQAQAQAAAQARAQAAQQAAAQVPAPQAAAPAGHFPGGAVPATQSARIVPTPSLAPQGLDPAPAAIPVAPTAPVMVTGDETVAGNNGAVVPPAQAQLAAPAPAPVGVG